LDGIENYAKRWLKCENADKTALNGWLEMIKIMIDSNIKKFKRNIHSPNAKVLSDPIVTQYLEDFHNKVCFGPS